MGVNRNCCLVLLFFVFAITNAFADVKMPGIFGDHMVLQRDKPIPVWGWADPGEEVTVTFGEATLSAKAGEDGKWRVTLPALKASATPQVLTVKGKNTVSLKDVLVGDVWICSGQSNMEWVVGNTNNSKEEIASADFPLIRHIKIAKKPELEPREDVSGIWQVASPKTVKSWTAVGFYFGRDLHKNLNVPIGLINSSWGGTRVEAWTSREVYEKLPGTEADLKKLDDIKSNLSTNAERYAEKMKAFKSEYAKLEKLERDAEHLKKYSSPSLDDSSWKDIKTPGKWEANGHPGLDGEVWYRRTIDIPAAWAGKELSLELGPIDEIDTAYYNGVKVGGMGSVKPLNTRFWAVPRRYTVPGELVKPGKALIAVRVVDQRGQGGLRGGKAEDMFIVPKDMKADAKNRIALSGNWKHYVTLELPKKPASPKNPNIATVLYNGLINGLIPYAIKGAIWYQGESNAGNAYAYRVRFPAMIKDWRSRWKQGDFPFLWVQLANFRRAAQQPENRSWAVVRESQNKTLSLPNTGTALAIDIGDAKDIHPRNKQDVGKRLALAARNVAYGEELVYAGPSYKSMKTEGDAIRISFDHIGGGLVAKGGELKHFSIAGKDQKFVWAKAVIDGDSVVVKAEGIKEPVAVRYAWADNPEGCNLYNKEGLPANPFRTDDWQVATQPKNK